MGNNMSTTAVRDTTWTKIVDNLEEPVGKTWEVAKENTALSVIGGILGGIAIGEIIHKYSGFRKHFVVPMTTLSAAGGAALFAEEARYDYADGKYVNGALKTAGAVATGATAVDLGTYYLNKTLGLKSIPRIPVYEYVWNNGMTFGGAAIALGGMGLLSDVIFNTNVPKDLYFVEIDNKSAVVALTSGEFLAGLTATLGGLELIARGNGYDNYRPLTGTLKFLFGNKYGQGTLAVAGGLTSIVILSDGINRVVLNDKSVWNDVLGLVETTGGAYGFAASGAWLSSITRQDTFANVMAWDSTMHRIASGSSLLFAGYAGGKYAFNDVREDSYPGGLGGLTGTGGLMAFLWGLERLKIFSPSNNVYNWAAGGGLGYATVGFGIDAVRNVQDGKYLNAAGNAALTSVTGASSLYFVANATGNKTAERLAEKFLSNVYEKVIEKVVKHPIATLGILGGAAAAGVGIYYASKDDTAVEEEKENGTGEPSSPVSAVE